LGVQMRLRRALVRLARLSVVRGESLDHGRIHQGSVMSGGGSLGRLGARIDRRCGDASRNRPCFEAQGAAGTS
jgi:hypothetical protein